jgi:hypothetical protein
VATGDDRLAVIRALLAKAEATEFEAEAATFRAKASELMARYAIDEALLWADRRGDEREVPSAVTIELRRPYVPQQAVLVNEVATAYGCRSVRFTDPGAPHELVEVVGFASDLRLVEALVTSLLVQMSHAMVQAQPSMGRAASTAAWRRSFMMGFIESVSSRLAADRAAAARDGGEPIVHEPAARRSAGAAALVLREREQQVDEELRRRHPYLRSSRVGGGSSWHGRESGQGAGRRADLGDARLQGRRALTSG